MKAATLCYLKRDGKTLMIHKNKDPSQFMYGFWNGIGGKIEPGEGPLENIVREGRDESGYTIINPALKGINLFFNFFGKDYIVFTYLTGRFEGELKKENHEGSVMWVDDNKLMDLKLVESDYLWLPLLEQDRFFTGLFWYVDNTKLIKHKIELY